MKKLMTTIALALAMIGTTAPAVAQPDRHDRHDRFHHGPDRSPHRGYDRHRRGRHHPHRYDRRRHDDRRHHRDHRR